MKDLRVQTAFLVSVAILAFNEEQTVDRVVGVLVRCLRSWLFHKRLLWLIMGLMIVRLLFVRSTALE